MRLYRLFAALCLLFSGVGAEAAPEGKAPQNPNQVAAQALADVCAKVACRKSARTFSLRTREGGEGKFNTAPFPYLDPDGNVIIFPGETITVVLPKDGNGKPRLLKVAEPSGVTEYGMQASTEASLEFRFAQMDGKPDMQLTATNTVPVMLKYDAIMAAVTAKGIQQAPTSICPLFPPMAGTPGFSGYESWPFPIVNLVIGHIRMLPKGAPRDCN